MWGQGLLTSHDQLSRCHEFWSFVEAICSSSVLSSSSCPQSQVAAGSPFTGTLSTAWRPCVPPTRPKVCSVLFPRKVWTNSALFKGVSGATSRSFDWILPQTHSCFGLRPIGIDMGGWCVTCVWRCTSFADAAPLICIYVNFDMSVGTQEGVSSNLPDSKSIFHLTNRNLSPCLSY